MRAGREEAARSRAKIVEVAGREFREHGYDGIGIAGLMEAAGRTHGGFYKQFDDKEALVVEATAQALAENRERWGDVMGKAPGDPVSALRRWYLSPPHRDRVADGCAYAALAAEAPRHDEALRRTFEEGLEASIALVADALPDESGRAEAIRIVAQLVGSLLLSRAVESPGLAAEILRSGHDGPSGNRA